MSHYFTLEGIIATGCRRGPWVRCRLRCGHLEFLERDMCHRAMYLVHTTPIIGATGAPHPQERPGSLGTCSQSLSAAVSIPLLCTKIKSTPTCTLRNPGYTIYGTESTPIPL